MFGQTEEVVRLGWREVEMGKLGAGEVWEDSETSGKGESQ